jgi:hypothetical protein
VEALTKLKAHHVDAALLAAQEAYFVYADELLAWINYEGRFRDKNKRLRGNNPLLKPKGVRRPKLRLSTARRLGHQAHHEEPRHTVPD